MELSAEELNQMLADARRDAAEEAQARLDAERQRLHDELAQARTRVSGGWVPPGDAPTVDAAVQMYLEARDQGTRRTYRTYLQGVLVAVPPCHGRGQLTEAGRLAIPKVDLGHDLCRQLGCDAESNAHAPLGPMSVSDLRDRGQELELLKVWVGRNAKANALAKLRRDRHKLLKDGTPDLDVDDVHVDLSEIDPATGAQAQRTYVTAVRELFKAQVPKYLDRSPADGLKLPKKHQTNRVAFDVERGQLDQVLEVGINAVPDPELLEVLCDFYLETGARLNEPFRLTLFKVNLEDCTVKIGQKNDDEEWTPVTPSTLARVLDLATARGMTPADPWVFRNTRGQRISKAQMERFWREVKNRLPFAAEMDAATHCFRKTMATLIERDFGLATSEAFLRHKDQPVALLYPKAGIRDVATALAALTREPHPLARGRWAATPTKQP